MEAKKKKFIEAMKRTLGNITKAAESIDVTRQTIYNWMEADKDFKLAIQNIDDYVIDFVENKLFEQIEQNNTVATIFYLKTKAKKRGYVERTESRVVDQDGKDISYEVTLNIR